MSDQYLWDKTGQPDPEIQKLEELLHPLRHTRPLQMPRRRTNRWVGIAAGVALLAAAGSSWFAIRASLPAWDVQRVAGAPRVGSSPLGGGGKLRLGQTLETDSSSRAVLDVADIGELKIDPNTRLRISESKTGAHRISLEKGVIHAMIWAPPRNFVVDTPSSTTIDLGCKYTLQVSPDGDGKVEVESGWVAFEWHGKESFIPQGAVCSTSRKSGPGIPWYLDAPDTLQQALRRYQTRASDEDMIIILAEARRKDAMTLWHLLGRVDVPSRIRVYEKLASLAPPPPGVTRDGVMRLASKDLDEWWNSLGLDDAAWWRKMERTLE
ncbi:MAG TPA: FecR family protein [Bryobacteraceae bacterium]|nr:FecR family protein [Bryobacteraceae bacterium]